MARHRRPPDARAGRRRPASDWRTSASRTARRSGAARRRLRISGRPVRGASPGERSSGRLSRRSASAPAAAGPRARRPAGTCAAGRGCRPGRSGTPRGLGWDARGFGAGAERLEPIATPGPQHPLGHLAARAVVRAYEQHPDGLLSCRHGRMLEPRDQRHVNVHHWGQHVDNSENRSRIRGQGGLRRHRRRQYSSVVPKGQPTAPEIASTVRRRFLRDISLSRSSQPSRSRWRRRTTSAVSSDGPWPGSEAGPANVPNWRSPASPSPGTM